MKERGENTGKEERGKEGARRRGEERRVRKKRERLPEVSGPHPAPVGTAPPASVTSSGTRRGGAAGPGGWRVLAEPR